MERYLQKYLLDNETDPLRKKYIEYFKIEMDWFIYNYGEHISKSHQKKQPNGVMGWLYRFKQDVCSLQTKFVDNGKSNILSKYILPELTDNYNFYSSILTPNGSNNIIGSLEAIRFRERKQRIINAGRFFDFLDKDFIEKTEKLKFSLKSQFESYNFKGGIFHTDQYFDTKFLIDIFKEMQIPTLLLLHGLPSSYCLDLDNRTDYLCVWGGRIKDHYINAGFDASKIYVTGNRKYSKIPKEMNLRNSYDDVLVIPPSAVLLHQNTWGVPTLIDRSVGALYLHMLEKVLKKLGIKKARYRIHPSLDKAWTHQFVDSGFYTVDDKPLTESLNKATLVIGSASSMLFDAIAHGVNYIMFEPQEEGRSLLGEKLIPPFDGADGLLVAKDLDDLENMLRTKFQNTFESVNGYIEPFNPSIIKNLLK